MEILSRRRRLANLEVIHRCELQEAFNAGAGVLRALAFVSVRKQQYQAGEQVPLGFAGNNELINDRLRYVGKVTKLRFPQNQSLRIVSAVAIFKSKDSRFRERGIVNLAARLILGDVLKRNEFLFVFNIEKD